jgi:transposase
VGCFLENLPMLEPLLLPSGAPLSLGAVELCADHVTVAIHTTAFSARCPGCQSDASRIHSHYQRTLADLPLAQVPVQIHLHVRRFFCDNATCRRKTFCEPVPALAPRYARRTARLLSEQRQVGLELGGEPGARQARRQAMAVSPDTLLRFARSAPQSPAPTPRRVGIDDFALRKGQVYGTIVVDLDAHRTIDLLPERSADVVEQWLVAHPGVELITRDRSGEYAEGASRGAPDAIQVADRFHLLQNVRELLQRLLERHQDALRAAQSSPRSPEASSTSAEASNAFTPQTTAPSRRSRAEQQRSQERRERRRARYELVKTLQAQGVSMGLIAEQAQLSQRTVRRFCRTEQFPERAAHPPQPSKLDPFIPYLEQQLTAGRDNALQLWRELREQYGYKGASRQVSWWVACHRHLVPPQDPATLPPLRIGRPPVGAPPRPAPPPQQLSARKAAWLLVARPKALTQEEQGIVERLCGQAEALATAYELAQAFIQMVRERRGERFDAWLAQVAGSGIPELQSFGVGLERDRAAVAAALSLPYSNGQVEGQVNRLKLIKRTAYGRAKFDLLRQRVLARAS